MNMFPRQGHMWTFSINRLPGGWTRTLIFRGCNPDVYARRRLQGKRANRRSILAKSNRSGLNEGPLHSTFSR